MYYVYLTQVHSKYILCSNGKYVIIDMYDIANTVVYIAVP
jgi:hypothetical protein